MSTKHLQAFCLIPDRITITIREEVAGEKTAEMAIGVATSADSGFYECQATNKFGSNSLHYQLQVQGELSLYNILNRYQ